MKSTRNKPQKGAEWKIEPVHAPGLADLRLPELVELLAAAYRRIRVLENQMSEGQAGGPTKIIS